MSLYNLLQLVCLLLPVAAMSGWYFGKRSAKAVANQHENALSSDYYAGLNFLLNEQTDKAVDAFIRMLDVSPDSVETTLALGSFFRRRGEVDRAIRIHQNLLAKPNLTTKQRNQSLLELAQNYLRAGVYDRAEALLLEITSTTGDHLETSLRHLIDIYEREKDWKKAIESSMRLQEVIGFTVSKEIAHYYCELAELAWSKGKIRLAHRYLKTSLRHDKHCARASLLQGNFEKKCSKYEQALRAYQRIEYQDAAFLPEVLLMIIECYEKMDAKEGLAQYLDYLMRECPTISIVLASADHMKNNQGKEKAAHFLANQLFEQPSIRGLKHLIEYHLARVVGDVRNELLMLKSLVEQLVEKKPIYRCGECGFSSRLLHWQCPSCREWSQVKPIQGIEGE